jgi:hypothetical protein
MSVPAHFELKEHSITGIDLAKLQSLHFCEDGSALVAITITERIRLPACVARNLELAWFNYRRGQRVR